MECQPTLADEQMAWDFVALATDSTTRFIGFLRSEPSPNDVAQELVLGYLSPFDARAAVISLVQPNATLSFNGGFGLPQDSILRWGTGSLWDDVPNAIAARSRTAVTSVTTHDAGRSDASKGQSGTTHPVVAVPLCTSTTTIGAMCVCFGSEAAGIDAAAGLLQNLADVYVLYLLTNNSEMRSSQAPKDHTQPDTKSPERELTAADFTDRQKTVLSLLSEGMTYDQIASRIGYSHSTVRMELMHVYRVLGVSSRREAVNHAMRHGLVRPLVEV